MSFRKILLSLLSLVFALSLFLPFVRGEGHSNLGLDLSGGVRVTYRPDFTSVPERYADLSEDALLAMAKETLSGRLLHRFDTLPDVVVRGDGKIVVGLPGEHDQRQVLETIGQTYRLSFRRALATHDTRPAESELARNDTLVRAYQGRWLELGEELLDGSMLDPRSIGVEPPMNGSLESFGQGATITFAFSPPHDARFAEVTRNTIGGTLAILLDDRVEWAGRVDEEIRGSGLLRGGYTMAEASEVAGLLRAGQLPLSLSVESLSAVGPSLGQEVLDRGRSALAWSVGLLTLLVMLAYGHRPALLITGLLSLGSLLFFTLGLITTLGLTVDLVAIAGLVLSIGMGMDAFILVFEALEGRHFAAKGRSPLGRLRQIYGFRGEGRTLVHANATTLLVVLLLFVPDRLQSFAAFLVVGIAASLLTLLLTHGVLTRFARRGWLEDEGEPGKVAGGLLAPVRQARPGLFRFRRAYYVLLALFLLGSVGWMANSQDGEWLRLGSDFRAGMQIQVVPQADADAGGASNSSDVRELVESWEERWPGLEGRYQTLALGSADGDATRSGWLISLEGEPWQGSTSVEWISELATDLGKRGFELDELQSVDARLSGQRILRSLSVMLFSFLFLGLYLRFFQHRIDRWLSPGSHFRAAGTRIFVGTVLAVALDIAVVLATLALLRIPVGMPVIAALLTIVGYSVNDSMVLWSHLSRPGRGEGDGGGLIARIREGVDRILSRTVLTSLSTLMPAIVILAVGLDPLRGFAWAVLVGTVSGTLSSMFVVASFAAMDGVGARDEGGAEPTGERASQPTRGRGDLAHG